MENVKVIDQKLMFQVADKYSDPGKLTLSIAFEATMQTHNAFDSMNRVNLLHQIRYQIEDLVNAELRRIAEEPTEEDAWDGDETHHINHGC